MLNKKDLTGKKQRQKENINIDQYIKEGGDEKFQ